MSKLDEQLDTGKTKQDSLRAFRIFKLESKRLIRLYDNSIYAYRTTRDSIYERIHSGSLKYEDPVEVESYDGNKFIIGRIATTAHNFRAQYPSSLRELVFIRLISAFEIFLVDTVREIFLSNRDLFHIDQDESIELKKSELINYSSLTDALEKYIQSECRSLQSRGYEGLKKYYVKSLAVDFARAEVNLSKISHYHDKRHLLVHNFGKTDEFYRHKYATDVEQISISEKELLEIQSELFSLVLYINNRLIELRSTSKYRTPAPTSPRKRNLTLQTLLDRYGIRKEKE